MLVEKWHLIEHAHKSGKQTIQRWISIPQKWAMIFIHNAVKKIHKRNWRHNFNHEKLKSSHWLQNICHFWQHITSHVKFGITYSHYYIIGFYTSQCNHRYGLIVYGWGKITYSCHLYFMTKFVLYVLFRAHFVSHTIFVSVGQLLFWKLMLFVDVTDMK